MNVGGRSGELSQQEACSALAENLSSIPNTTVSSQPLITSGVHDLTPSLASMGIVLTCIDLYHYHTHT